MLWILTLKGIFCIVSGIGDQKNPGTAFRTSRVFSNLVQQPRQSPRKVFHRCTLLRSVSRDPYWVLWESRTLSPTQCAPASESPFPRVGTLQCGTGFCSGTIQPFHKNPRSKRKSQLHTCLRSRHNLCSHCSEIFTVLYGLYFLPTVAYEEPKIHLFQRNITEEIRRWFRK